VPEPHSPSDSLAYLQQRENPHEPTRQRPIDPRKMLALCDVAKSGHVPLTMRQLMCAKYLPAYEVEEFLSPAAEHE